MAKRNSKRGNYVYNPAHSGWVTINDKLSQPIWYSFHCDGNAQEVLDAVLSVLADDGWHLESRFADSLFANRDGDRVHISIRRCDPSKSAPLS